MKRPASLAVVLCSVLAMSGCGWTVTVQPPATAPSTPPPPRTVTEAAPPPPTVEQPVPQQAGQSGCFATYQTAQSSVQLCWASGQIYYYGSSQSGTITLPAYAAGAGTYQTESNDGYVYTISAEELLITSDGAVVSEQPVLSTTGG